MYVYFHFHYMCRTGIKLDIKQPTTLLICGLVSPLSVCVLFLGLTLYDLHCIRCVFGGTWNLLDILLIRFFIYCMLLHVCPFIYFHVISYPDSHTWPAVTPALSAFPLILFCHLHIFTCSPFSHHFLCIHISPFPLALCQIA